jgi:DNA-binding NarL/FixJ family response regulator
VLRTAGGRPRELGDWRTRWRTARKPRSSELTETERRVAELVAQGLSNKEVAARLFVTVRTVEANLTRIYAKLGVRSRTELTSRLRS